MPAEFPLLEAGIHFGNLGRAMMFEHIVALSKKLYTIPATQSPPIVVEPHPSPSNTAASGPSLTIPNSPSRKRSHDDIRDDGDTDSSASDESNFEIPSLLWK